MLAAEVPALGQDCDSLAGFRRHIGRQQLFYAGDCRCSSFVDCVDEVEDHVSQLGLRVFATNLNIEAFVHFRAEDPRVATMPPDKFLSLLEQVALKLDLVSWVA